MGGMERIKGGRNEQQSDMPKIIDRNVLYLNHFGAENVRLFTKSALCLYLDLCFLSMRGAQFQKNHETSGQKVNNGAGRP